MHFIVLSASCFCVVVFFCFVFSFFFSYYFPSISSSLQTPFALPPFPFFFFHLFFSAFLFFCSFSRFFFLRPFSLPSIFPFLFYIFIISIFSFIFILFSTFPSSLQTPFPFPLFPFLVYFLHHFILFFSLKFPFSSRHLSLSSFPSLFYYYIFFLFHIFLSLQRLFPFPLFFFHIKKKHYHIFPSSSSLPLRFKPPSNVLSHSHTFTHSHTSDPSHILFLIIKPSISPFLSFLSSYLSLASSVFLPLFLFLPLSCYRAFNITLLSLLMPSVSSSCLISSHICLHSFVSFHRFVP